MKSTSVQASLSHAQRALDALKGEVTVPDEKRAMFALDEKLARHKAAQKADAAELAKHIEQASINRTITLNDHSAMDARESASSRYAILDQLENSATFRKAYGVDAIAKFSFVREAIDAKRSGRIARLTDFVQKPYNAMDANTDLMFGKVRDALLDLHFISPQKE